MSIVKNGTFDIASDAKHAFTFRFHWNGEYDDVRGVSTITISKVEVLSTKYGGRWFPGGTITVNGEVIADISYYADPDADCSFYVFLAGDTWYTLTDIFTDYTTTWSSGEIYSSDIAIGVNLELYSETVSLSPKPAINGTYTISFTDGEVDSEPIVDPHKDKIKRLITGIALGFLLTKEREDDGNGSSATQTEEYRIPYQIPTSGTGTTANDALNKMFTETGGTFIGTPVFNTTYYTSNTVV